MILESTVALQQLIKTFRIFALDLVCQYTNDSCRIAIVVINI